MNDQQDFDFAKAQPSSGAVECLGGVYESVEERRSYFSELLRKKLKDPDFLETPGFPRGDEDAILQMSDPPYYTACPNPFLTDFVQAHGREYDPSEHYEREPFAVDVSVGKTDQLYKAHSYHTKVPHLAIVPSILHYTQPGDFVLDGFCGSGMTGLAAQWCGSAPPNYRQHLEVEWQSAGHSKPVWGTRRAVLNDLGPAASFIAAGYNLPFNVEAFEEEVQRIMDETSQELGWMYEALHTDGKTKGRINYTVWSDVFSCPECVGEVNFTEEALDPETKRVHDTFPCPHCQAELSKKRLDRFYVTVFDKATGKNYKVPKRLPVLINYNLGTVTYERPPTAADIEILEKIERLPLPPEVPTDSMMDSADDVEVWGDKYRAGTASFSHVHHMFLPRAGHALAALWRKAHAVHDVSTKRMVVWCIEQAIWGMSVLARYTPTHYSQVNQYLSGVYYVGSQIVDVSPWYILYDEAKRTSKLPRLVKCFSPMPAVDSSAMIQTGDCASIPLPAESIDYIFTDPPFGANFAYAELNFLVEAWHRVKTNIEREAIQSPFQRKNTLAYQELMRGCFSEYHRLLKPGRWMTVVFSNNSNAVWRAIQEAIGTAGFVIADVRTLDKKQGTFNQVAGHTVKQDLVISAYKPTAALAQRFELDHSTAEGAWIFVKEHLRNVPVFVGRADEGEVVAERTAQMLLDRMIAFHVQRGISLPLSGPEFLQGLSQRFPERDGMYFLPDQVAEFDRKRMSVSALRQLNLFVSDEASARRMKRFRSE